MRMTRGNENVFVDCGFPPAEAENLRIRAKMMMALTAYIQEEESHSIPRRQNHGRIAAPHLGSRSWQDRPVYD